MQRLVYLLLPEKHGVFKSFTSTSSMDQFLATTFALLFPHIKGIKDPTQADFFRVIYKENKPKLLDQSLSFLTTNLEKTLESVRKAVASPTHTDTPPPRKLTHEQILQMGQESKKAEPQSPSMQPDFMHRRNLNEVGTQLKQAGSAVLQPPILGEKRNLEPSASSMTSLLQSATTMYQNKRRRVEGEEPAEDQIVAEPASPESWPTSP
jgi:hypothetical protein